jgi:hypothetical protein
MEDKITKPRNYEMRDFFKMAGFFAKWIATQQTFIIADFTLACNEHKFAKSVQNHFNGLARGFLSMGLISRTGIYRRASSTSPASPVYKVNKTPNQ